MPEAEVLHMADHLFGGDDGHARPPSGSTAASTGCPGLADLHLLRDSVVAAA